MSHANKEETSTLPDSDRYQLRAVVGAMIYIWVYEGLVESMLNRWAGNAVFLGIVALTTGLALPRLSRGWVKTSYLTFLLFASLGPAYVGFEFLSDPCVHVPGRSFCETNPEKIDLIKFGVLRFVVLAPIVVAALFGGMGVYIRYREKVPEKERLSPHFRMFCWLTGGLFLMFSACGIVEGYRMMASGTVLTGIVWMLASLGAGLFLGAPLFDLGCHCFLMKSIARMFGSDVSTHTVMKIFARVGD